MTYPVSFDLRGDLWRCHLLFPLLSATLMTMAQKATMRMAYIFYVENPTTVATEEKRGMFVANNGYVDTKRHLV
jgi:hypothetical protein